MKIAYRYTVLLLLIIAFSSKTLNAVWAGYSVLTTQNTKQQEHHPEEEKDPEKAIAKEKFEATDLVAVQQWTFAPFIAALLFYTWQHKLLPSQYGIVPTPPPWGKS